MRSTPPLIALVATILLGACSTGSPATPTVPPPPSATSTVATPIASAAAATPTAVVATPSVPLGTPTGEPIPSLVANDLASLIPTQVAGVPVSVMTLTPDQIAQLSDNRYGDLATALGRSVDDLQVVFASAGTSELEQVSMEAFRIPGADSQALLQAEIQRLLSIMVEGTESMPITLGGKNVIQVGEQDPSFPKFARYVYAVGDAVFSVQGNSDELIADMFSQLP
jgi:hypothetical protein